MDTIAREVAEPLAADTRNIGPAPVLPPSDDRFKIEGIDVRERALPIRPGDLTRMILAQEGISAEDHESLSKISPLLGAVFHGEFYERIRELKELYAPLDPDSDYVALQEFSKKRTEQSDEEFLVPFDAMLTRANYRRLDVKVIQEAVEAPNELGLTYQPDFNQFEHLRIYVRGFTQVSRTIRNFSTRFRKKDLWLDAYQRMVVVLKFKAGLDAGPFVRSDVVYLRLFKDVPHVDMEMHLPEQGTRVRMRPIDKAQIASPMIMGVPTLLIKLFAAWTINPFVLAPLLIAPVSAGVNSFFGFQRAKHKHLSSMIRSLYYLTLANNSSVLVRLIDSAEEEEFKETIIAFYALWRIQQRGDQTDRKGLDHEVEHLLRQVSGVEVNFEIDDALSKLFRLGLATRKADGSIVAASLERALARLDRRWDDINPSTP